MALADTTQSVQDVSRSFLKAVLGNGSGYFVLSYTDHPKMENLKSEYFDATDIDAIATRASQLSKTLVKVSYELLCKLSIFNT